MQPPRWQSVRSGFWGVRCGGLPRKGEPSALRWMALHNPENRRKVTGELSTMEFSIAMLASGGWTNKEIGEHLGISINTVKHYLTDIFCKLNVKKRDELKKFMLK
ncbi:helix-turn-helix transcriptional regulator [Blautia massiliensis]|nr:helix-turn-helix transcriptional regulator [Blautia massiliensis (ex Durand et al. 2017)]